MNEASSIEVCVGHKSCLQREVTVEVTQDTLGMGVYQCSTHREDCYYGFLGQNLRG